MAKRGTLNPRQQLFVKHYLQTMNATQSLIKAGYKTKYPGTVASELLAKPYIAKEIEKTKQVIVDYQNQLIKTKTGLAPVTFEDSVNMLRSIAIDTEADNRDKISAIKEINAMFGYLAPVQTTNTQVTVDLNKVQELTKQFMLDGSLKIEQQEKIIELLPVSVLTSNDEKSE